MVYAVYGDVTEEIFYLLEGDYRVQDLGSSAVLEGSRN